MTERDDIMTTTTQNGATVFDPDMAQLNITFNRQNGDLPDPIPYSTTPDVDMIKSIAREAIQAGSVPGIDQHDNPDFSGYEVEPYPAREDVRVNRYVLRPKTTFGS